MATIFLTNRECPWKCLMCDLWKNTLEDSVPPGAIPEQIREALRVLPPARRIKLYNAGSFFDGRAVPPEDHAAIAELVAPSSGSSWNRTPRSSGPAVGPSATGSRGGSKWPWVSRRCTPRSCPA